MGSDLLSLVMCCLNFTFVRAIHVHTCLSNMPVSRVIKLFVMTPGPSQGTNKNLLKKRKKKGNFCGMAVCLLIIRAKYKTNQTNT